MNAPTRTQRPIALRDVRLDEKTARFFVNKVIKAVQEETLLRDAQHNDQMIKVHRSHGASLGNPKGRKRFLQRLQRNIMPSSLSISASTTAKKAFYFIDDYLTSYLDNNQLTIARLVFYHRNGQEPTVNEYPVLDITHHALVRAVMRANVRSTEDVLDFLKSIWTYGLYYAIGAIQVGHLTTPGDRGWLVPCLVRQDDDDLSIAVLIKRPEAETPSVLVTVYEEAWMPTHLLEAAREYVDAHNKADGTLDSSKRLAGILPRLLA